MTKYQGNYKGNIAKYGFPLHEQEHAMSCGPACMRMLAEWATKQPQSEYGWRERSEWKANVGLYPEGMAKALVDVPNLVVTNLPKQDIVEWSKSDSLLTSFGKDADSVYLLYTDSYGYDGNNLHHWIVLLDIFDAAVEEKGSGHRKLALYADPSADALTVWPWRSLLESKVLEGFHIERSR